MKFELMEQNSEYLGQYLEIASYTSEREG